MTQSQPHLVEKYNVPGPRYTSYPTVPMWENNVAPTAWMHHAKGAFDHSQSGDGMALYIHLPFCESLCTYCGCNTRITKNHRVETPYLEALLAEWHLYVKAFGSRPILRELHLGGGTPTFFSAQNLKLLVEGIFAKATRHSQFEGAFEGHPNNTTAEHLQILSDLGFTRVSFGIQDNDPRVQLIINRVQPWENVAKVTSLARQAGFSSVNFDLVYGLPLQTQDSVSDTLARSIKLRPDRIAFYSYAHVPWLRPGQRRYTEADLPSGPEKRQLYETGKQMLQQAGYAEIGLDHFALPGDALHDAMLLGTLHRNFMGYTTGNSPLLIGLGSSAISDSGTAFIQNPKTVEEYTAAIASRQITFPRSHELTAEDLRVRRCILDIMCRMQTNTRHLGAPETFWRSAFAEMINDGLLEFNQHQLTVLPKGKPFLRNICMMLDLRLRQSLTDQNMFSRTV